MGEWVRDRDKLRLRAKADQWAPMSRALREEGKTE